MKIGLLGGSFDPVHLGHIYIAQKAIKKMKLDQVWLVPTAQNPLKKKSFAPYKTRLEACCEMVKNHPKIFVKDFEKYSVATFDLVRRIKQKHPRDQFFWVMGQDSFASLPLWKNYAKLVRMLPFVVVSRSCEKVLCAKKPAPKTTFLRVKKFNISSSEIRKL